MKVRSRPNYRCRWLIFAAVFCLTVNVATRYCFITRSDAQGIQKVTSRPARGERQRLLSDALHWVAPAVSFQLLEPRPAVRIAFPVVPAVTDRYLEDCLYNRPPPSC
jgi:hypothetical protein